MTTDITELAHSLKAAATDVKETAHIARYVKATIARQTFKELMTPDNVLALVEALEKAQRANAAQDDHINQQQDRIEQLEKGNQYAGKRIAELEPIRAAAEKLVRCKGRYHSEQNYRALAALFGVTTPDLLPIDGESRTVTPVTYSENADADHCRKWAWEQVKTEVSTEGWTTGDNITYFGFFCWGWDMRRQYNEQRAVTVKLPRLNPEMFNEDVMFGYRKAQKEAVEFCAAAGIKVEAE